MDHRTPQKLVDDEMFLSQNNGPLAIMKHYHPVTTLAPPGQFETEKNVTTEDTITTTRYPSGKNVTRHTHKTTISRKVVEFSSWEDSKSLRLSGNKSGDIEIFQDECEDADMFEEEMAFDSDEDKENIEPKDNVGRDKMKLDEERLSVGTKRKHSEDWS